MSEGNGTQAAQAAAHAVCAVVTRASKTRNQDAVACGAQDGLAVVAVADGVSGSDDLTGLRSATVAQAAADYMVKRVLDQAEHLAAGGGAADSLIFSDDWFDHTFAALPHVCEAALANAEEGSTAGPSDRIPETTLIAAISLPEQLIVVYAGDGVAKVMTGRLRVGRNLLIPHANDYGHLTRYVSAEAAVQPTIVRLRTNFDDGELVLIGSDGAFPNRANDPTVFIIDTIKQQLTQEDGPQAPVEIGETIVGVLEQAIGAHPHDDDASIGVILSQRALDYWQQSMDVPAPTETEEAPAPSEVPDADH